MNPCFTIMVLFGIFVMVVGTTAIPPGYSQTLDLFTDNSVYSDNRPLFVYGKSTSNENLIIRLITPDETIAKFDQLVTNDDGTFSHLLLTWPDTSIDFPYGTYTIEIISSSQNGLSKKATVKFSSTTDLIQVPVERNVNTLVFAPETAAVNNSIRVFVQTTSDGLLVGENNPGKLLQTSHVHLPTGKVDNISPSFMTLHNGLYYVDYTPQHEGTFVFHIVSFNQGSVSHGSAATNVLSQDLGGISDEITRLNHILNETSSELDILKSEVSDFGIILDKASKNIDSSVTSMSVSVQNIEEASIQLNSLLFPVVAFVAIILALQITIIARSRQL